MRAHIIENGVVTNTIEVESLDVIPGLIDASSGKIGDLWDGATFTTPPEVVVIPRRFVPLDFFALFTDAEQLAIATAAIQNASILLWFQKASGATSINLDDKSLIAGMRALMGAGLLTQPRHDRIMSGLAPL